MTANLLYKDQRLAVANTALSLHSSGLVINTSGNVSQRLSDHVIITPSGKAYQQLQPEDICVIDLEGNRIDGEFLPSSETPLHLALYHSDPAIKAIVHTHSVHATAVSTLIDELPAVHYQMVDLGGKIPVAPYATFGSTELANSVLGVIAGHKAVLMKNHGSISFAATLEKALARTITLEWCCEVWLKATMAGAPTTLNEQELQLVAEQMQKMAEARLNPEFVRPTACCSADKA